MNTTTRVAPHWYSLIILLNRLEQCGRSSCSRKQQQQAAPSGKRSRIFWITGQSQTTAAAAPLPSLTCSFSFLLFLLRSATHVKICFCVDKSWYVAIIYSILATCSQGILSMLLYAMLLQLEAFCIATQLATHTYILHVHFAMTHQQLACCKSHGDGNFCKVKCIHYTKVALLCLQLLYYSMKASYSFRNALILCYKISYRAIGNILNQSGHCQYDLIIKGKFIFSQSYITYSYTHFCTIILAIYIIRIQLHKKCIQKVFREVKRTAGFQQILGYHRCRFTNWNYKGTQHTTSNI